jgi:hypothetical protein
MYIVGILEPGVAQAEETDVSPEPSIIDWKSVPVTTENIIFENKESFGYC